MVYANVEIIDNWMDPDFKFFVNRGSPKKCMEFLMQDKDMKDEYLGACLDYIRWGGQETVMYELGTKGMINFIREWIDLNKNNLIWNEKTPSKDFTLPYIKHKKCPRNEKHKGTIKDLGGRVRCAHKSEKKFKPNFIFKWKNFNDLAQLNKIEYSDWSPACYAPGNDELLKKFDEEQKTEFVVDFCYSILSDEKTILSLEKVLDRLNLQPRIKTVYCPGLECKRLDEIPKNERWLYEGCMCRGHKEENNVTIHPFSGWTLSSYVQKWYEQVPNREAPVFEK